MTFLIIYKTKGNRTYIQFEAKDWIDAVNKAEQDNTTEEPFEIRLLNDNP